MFLCYWNIREFFFYVYKLFWRRLSLWWINFSYFLGKVITKWKQPWSFYYLFKLLSRSKIKKIFILLTLYKILKNKSIKIPKNDLFNFWYIFS